jgi:hypothetical protein
MVSFALITEGETDQAVLRNILIGLYGADVDVTELQPLRDTTDSSRIKSDSFGGWEKVFEYCQYENFEEVFEFNDYVIIQIDTDMGEHVNFGVPLTRDGIDRPVEDLVDDVRNKIIAHINQNSYQQYNNQFKFAIAVHSLECWLLPLYAKIPHTKKIKECETRLKYEGQQIGLESTKKYPQYDKLSRQYRKPKELEKAKQHQSSLALFLDSLPQF